MKKRRDENRKGKTSSESSGSANGVDSGSNVPGGGVGAPKADEHHNTSTPCANLARDIALEIFPLMASSAAILSLASAAGVVESSSNDGGDDEISKGEKMNSKNSGEKKSKKGEGKINYLGIDDGVTFSPPMKFSDAYPPPPMFFRDETPPSNNGKDSASQGGVADGSTAPTQEQQPQPLLGCIVQNHLIRERRRIRSEQGVSSTMVPNKSDGGNENSNSKKKKKKKRKKKGGQTTVGTAAEASVEGGDNEEEEAAVDEREADNDCEVVETVASIDTSKNDAANAKKPQAASIDNNNIPSSSSNNETSTVSGLECFLDSLIDSANTSRVIGNRDLDSFAAFLSRKFESFLQQQRPKEKTKGNNRKGGVNAAVGKEEKCIFSPSIELKDILPTVSLTEVKSHVESVSCRQCRTCAANHLRSLPVYTSTSPSTNGNGIHHANSNGTNGGENGNKTVGNGSNSNGSSHNGALHNSSFKGVLELDANSAKMHTQFSSNGASSNGNGHAHSGLSIPITGKYHNDVDRAFDYMAMEDGNVDLESGQCSEKENENGNESTSSFCLKFHPLSHASDDARFLQMKPITTENSKGGKKLEYPVNSNDITNLIKMVLLPCGMEHAQLTEAESMQDNSSLLSLSNEEFAIIAYRAKTLLGELKMEFLPSGVLLKEVNEKIEQVNVTNSRTIFDSTSAKCLNDCDKECETILVQLGKLLLRVTKLCCFIGWSSEYGPHLMKTLMNAWDTYDSTLIELVQPVLNHQGTVLQITGRTGRVPQAYLNTTIRNSLRETVVKKIDLIGQLHESLRTIFLEPRHKSYTYRRKDAPSSMVILCVLVAHLEHVCQGNSSVQDVFPTQDSEDQFMSFLSARIDLSQKTNNGGSPDAVKLKEKEQFDAVKKLDDLINAIVQAQLLDLMRGEESPPLFLKESYDCREARRNNYDHQQKMNALIASKIESGLDSTDTRMLLQKSQQLTMQWVHLLCMRQYQHTSAKPFTLPKRLKDWLESASGSDFADTEENQEGKKQGCDGGGSGGGKRRVNSVLSTLLYRWLEARCLEWHAELTRDELLQSMDMENPVSVREGGSKVGKKKKAKRKSGGGDKAKSATDGNALQNTGQKSAISSKEGGAPKVESINEESDAKESPSNTETSLFDVSGHATHADESQKEAKFRDDQKEAKIQSDHVVIKKQLDKSNTSIEISSGKNKNEKHPTSVIVNNKNDKLQSSEILEKGSVSTEDEKQLPVNPLSAHTKSDQSSKKCAKGNPMRKPDVSAENEGKQPVDPLSQKKTDPSINKLEDGSSTEESVENFPLWRSTVGIVDGQKVVPAETYLLKRIEAILGLKGFDSMPSSKKVPVVRL